MQSVLSVIVDEFRTISQSNLWNEVFSIPMSTQETMQEVVSKTETVSSEVQVPLPLSA